MGRVGILGGTFNPVHLGHLFVAEEVAWRLSLDRLLLIPCAVPPHKGTRELAPAEDRLAMTRLAAAGNPRLAVSDVEIRRGGTSYTIRTLDELARESPEEERFLIVGADSIPELPAWYRASEIERRAQWVVVARPGYDFGALERLAPILGEGGVERLRRHCLEARSLNISSTEVRRRVRAGEPIRYMVPDGVADLIRSRCLYRGSPAGA
ncbi:MAG: nicotinate-nucleotide adenylyltransferase [Planctomycetes bacterium]|nr:nicotinate-nucleotide adenylyltransferase [Planctomycetota bacterium]